MHPIIYDVAVSLDGYIAGVAGDISRFAHDGPVVDDYAARLGTYKMALMGRDTYTFAYDYGLAPGQNPYPHLKTVVFSGSLDLPSDAPVAVVRQAQADEIRQLADTAGGPVYLCGGGAFAGWMLENGLIDRLILKRAPCVLGGGVRLFGDASPASHATRIRTTPYENGYLLEEFSLR